ncbi:LysR family transcriptional regulator [Vibrio sinensis]|uniref:LysR family transcriptional regulator n=1 Tax=Vibrio sinensis TaxID=2302434 RepID=A0A3A6QPN0_9VIBR|nr:LysR family transcriptional regulator [Vibrio sinensis]RJX74393.1 LysR family transcriptional regulator [Vibrio sinensis]
MLLEGIETLITLSTAKTMSRTGSLLYISQSAVSKRITNLENKLGKKLVEPDGRHIKLTADALALIENIGPSFNELRGLMFDQQTLQDDSIIRIDCSETLVAGYLSEVMSHHFQMDPYITITTNHTPRIVEHVQSGKATIGFCAGHLPPHHGLHTVHLFDEPFFVISKTHLTSIPSHLITNDLNNPANTYQFAILEKLGIVPLMEMDSYVASAQLALAGVAPAIIPKSIVNTLNIDAQYCFEFVELQPLFRPIHLCTRANTSRNPRVKKLIAAIVDAAPKVISSPSTSTS